MSLKISLSGFLKTFFGGLGGAGLFKNIVFK
jgi:hypothetical protein